MKKILILLFSIFLLVSCDTLQTSNTINVGTNNSYWDTILIIEIIIDIIISFIGIAKSKE